MRERIAITGLGVVAPTAVGAEAFGAALRAGRPGVRAIEAFESSGLEVRIAAEVDDSTFDAADYVDAPKVLKLMNRATRFAVGAAAQARRHAKLGPGDVDPYRLAITLGAGGMGPVDLDLLMTQARAIYDATRNATSASLDIPAFSQALRGHTNPLSTLRGLPNLAAANLAIQHGARGANDTITTACTSGTQAIGEGMRKIQRGEADVVICGGTDAMVNPIGILGFALLGTLSRRNDAPGAASRPFERDRDGFVVGEGAGIVILERESFARARGAEVIAELAGYAATCDAYRITDERPDGGSAARAILESLRDADANIRDVGYINAHGTGTPMNDLTETRAIKEAFCARAPDVPVSSTKSMIGHLLAAAGAVELVACTVAMRGEFLPPTINYDVPDPRCDLDYVPNASRASRFDVALSNSFGFGGQNACLVVRRW